MFLGVWAIIFAVYLLAFARQFSIPNEGNHFVVRDSANEWISAVFRSLGFALACVATPVAIGDISRGRADLGMLKLASSLIWVPHFGRLVALVQPDYELSMVLAVCFYWEIPAFLFLLVLLLRSRDATIVDCAVAALGLMSASSELVLGPYMLNI